MSSASPIRLLIHGARGRMGSRLVAMARDDARFEAVAAIDLDNRASAATLQRGSVDVIIDFSSDQGALHAIQLASQTGAALFVGTTGLSPETSKLLQKTAESTAVMLAANTSLGVAVVSHLAREAARILGPEFNIDIVEQHHTAKRDAPSGTALRIKHAIEQAIGAPIASERVHCLRAGDIVGEHMIQFAGPGEVVTISHSATNRDLFVRGALRAAAYLSGKAPGIYTIEQSFGL